MPLFKAKNKRSVYLDHAAATPLSEDVFLTLEPYLIDNFANPSAIYNKSVVSRKAIDDSRADVAFVLKAQISDIIFTSGGTESINLAIQGLAKREKRGHIITTKIEHHAVLNSIKELEKQGFDVTYLKVDKRGQISIEELEKNLRPDTFLISVMYANNEVGSVMNISQIGKELLKWRKKHNTQYPYFHTDACQATNYLDLNVEKLHVDLMSLNGSKIYGPKGSGILYKRSLVEIDPIVYGGGQEFGLWSGTEDVASYVGFAKALNIANENRETNYLHTQKLRDYFWEQLQKKVKDIKLNGPELDQNRLPNNLNVCIPKIDPETFIIYMDEAGVQCSSGSACTTDSDEVSHVLLSLGLNEQEAKSSIRFTLGNNTTKKDIEYVLSIINEVIEKSRE